MSSDSAKGIPSRKDYGSPEELVPGSLVKFVVQKHMADRAGTHRDIRLGNNRLLSWASRKGLPEKPGQARKAINQPVHSGDYASFEGTIPEGYGKGKVESEIQGDAYIVDSGKDHVTFTTAHEQNPRRFRLQKSKDDWMLIDVTPSRVRDYEKLHYKKVPKEDVEKFISEDNRISEKLDGTSIWLEALGEHLEDVSHRVSKRTGRPIVHSERSGASQVKTSDLPERLRNAVLRAELLAVKDGKPIPHQQLGGLLNSTVGGARRRSKNSGINWMHALFDVHKYKGEPMENKPYSERLKLLKDYEKHLPPHFFIPEGYTEPKKQRKLLNAIFEGRHPMTDEGVVIAPLKGGTPLKAKNFSEHDVVVKDIFPGKGKHSDKAGGFKYALKSDPKRIVGKVGTGFSDETRRDMKEHPEKYVGRIAKVLAEQQYDTGALRVPSFHGLHEG